MSGPFSLRSEEIREALRLVQDGPASRNYSSVSIDTRTLRPGALFVAIKGERHDAVDLLPDAEERGALGAIVPEGRALPVTDLELFGVPDPVRALGDLASWRRRRSGARVVGITGSSGKTTAKEMAARALGGHFSLYKTAGNLNSQVGLPLAILDAPVDSDLWVLELGSSEPGEIARLAEIAAPTDAVITTVGPAHLEFFGSVDGVLEEKLSLVERSSAAGVVVVGERPDRLGEEALQLRPDALVVGVGERASWRPESYEVAADQVRFVRGGTTYRVPAGGRHHLADALIVAALAEALGVPAGTASEGLATYRPLGMRSALEQYGGLTVIADCYNANPESFEAAIEYCTEAFPGRRLVAVVGTMLELGDESERAHREIARHLVQAHFDLVAATGDFVSAFRDLKVGRNGTGLVAAESVDRLWAGLAPRLSGDEVVLVKASRGVGLDGIVERLRAFGEGSDPATDASEAARGPSQAAQSAGGGHASVQVDGDG